MSRFYAVAYCVVRPILRLLCPFRTEGLERLPDGAALICANHASAVDPVLVAVAMPRRSGLRFMAKAELFRNPVLAWIIRRCGAFPIHRGENDIVSLKTALRCLQNGEKLLLFPEGTRVDREGETDAKGGAVMMALRTGAPIVPVYCGGKRKLFCRSRVVFGAPYHPRCAGRRPTAEENRRLAQELLDRIYALKDEGEEAASGEGSAG